MRLESNSFLTFSADPTYFENEEFRMENEKLRI
jgi:hypothetical protein